MIVSIDCPILNGVGQMLLLSFEVLAMEIFFKKKQLMACISALMRRPTQHQKLFEMGRGEAQHF